MSAKGDELGAHASTYGTHEAERVRAISTSARLRATLMDKLAPIPRTVPQFHSKAENNEFMSYRMSERARTDCSVRTEQERIISIYRGIEVSPTGIVIDRGRPIRERDKRIFIHMEITLPERIKPLRAVARPVWSYGTHQAFKFVRISDVDRLNLAEHVDLVAIRQGHLN